MFNDMLVLAMNEVQKKRLEKAAPSGKRSKLECDSCKLNSDGISISFFDLSFAFCSDHYPIETDLMIAPMFRICPVIFTSKGYVKRSGIQVEPAPY